jgi:hypothetical protein
VKSLGQSAFEGSKLQSLDLSGLALESIGDRVLAYCPSLKQVSLPASLPDNTLPDNTFAQSTALESVNLPQNLETIGIAAFSGCASLSDADLPPSLKAIKQQAFMGCAVFTPDIGTLIALETLESDAFNGCKELTTLRLPESITTLESRVFEGCGNLTLAEIPASLVDLIDYTTFRYCRNLQFKVGTQEPRDLLIAANGTLRAYPGAVGAVSFPEGIKEIPIQCFQHETGITSISLPASLETIGNMAFDGCTNIATVTVPEDSQLKTIGVQTFQSCTKLTTIDLPTSLVSIDGYGFYGATLLESLICRAATPPTLGENVFYQTAEGLKVYVPDTSVDAYKVAAVWKDLSDKIYGLSSRP